MNSNERFRISTLKTLARSNSLLLYQLSYIKHRNAENEWKKEKAILSQKIEIMDLQLQEAKNREQNLKKMNEAFMSSI